MALSIRDEVIDELLQGYNSPEDLIGAEGLFKELKKRLLERALGAELNEHLGYEKGDPAGRGSGNSRNGSSPKTILTEDDESEIAGPRPIRLGSLPFVLSRMNLTAHVLFQEPESDIAGPGRKGRRAEPPLQILRSPRS